MDKISDVELEAQIKFATERDMQGALIILTELRKLRKEVEELRTQLCIEQTIMNDDAKFLEGSELREDEEEA